MNTQAIKIIQDKMGRISEQEKIFRESWNNEYADNNAMVSILLEWIINEIKSLPSLDIDSLQRYDLKPYTWIERSKEWFFIIYDDLLNLLKND